MGKPTGFMEFERIKNRYRPVKERVHDFKEVEVPVSDEELQQEGARCMDCGTPYCHALGCPIQNVIPEWNDAVYKDNWYEAWQRLEMVNPFPEITGRVCPAPCEASCALSINSSPVSIKQLELAIIERAFTEGWVSPNTRISGGPSLSGGEKIAVIGSGPAGLTAARYLSRLGHRVTLFEKAAKSGGLLRYGIPDFKLSKAVLDRRLEQMEAEGVDFENSVIIGEDLSVRYLRRKYSVIVLATGARCPRDISVPGRDKKGIYLALDYLTCANQYLNGEIPNIFTDNFISAKNKKILVIGGGDTGSDCVGTALRQGATDVTQIEILPDPLNWQNTYNPNWPYWPNILRTSTSHQEGCKRLWGITTTRFSGIHEDSPSVSKAHCKKVVWETQGEGERPQPVEVPGSDFEIETDLVLLAMGFVHVEHSKLLTDLGIELNRQGNIALKKGYMTSVPGIFSAGDAHSGASLVVRAMNHGKIAAFEIDIYSKSCAD